VDSPHSLLFGIAIAVGMVTASASRADTLNSVQGDRRVVIGYRVNPDQLQTMLPAQWQVSANGPGPTEGANFFVTLIERGRDEAPDATLRQNGTYSVIFRVVARHSETGVIGGLIVGGFAQTSSPGYYQTSRQASFRVERSVTARDEAETISESWVVEGRSPAERLEVRFRASPSVKTRTRDKGEANTLSAKDTALWRIYRFESVTDIVRSAPRNIDLVEHYSLALTSPEFRKLFDGSEQLVSVSLTPWYSRQTFLKN
jgi:hypothetical protein